MAARTEGNRISDHSGDPLAAHLKSDEKVAERYRKNTNFVRLE